MRTFIQYGLRLFLIWLSILSLMLLISRGQPPPAQLETLHLNQCRLPCWIGIIPGTTTIGEAYTLLKNTYPTSEYDYAFEHNPFEDTNWFTVMRTTDNIHFSVNFNHWGKAAAQSASTVISQITIINARANLRLGDWYRVLGAPQSLSISWGNYTAAPNLLYEQQQARLTLFNVYDPFAVNSAFIPANKLDIYEQVQLEKNYHRNYRVAWQGLLTSNKDSLMALMQP